MVVASVVMAAGGLLVAAVFNRLLRARRGVDDAWAQIDVQLHRRRSLIPELVATAEGSLHRERDLIDRLVSARHAAEGARPDDVEARAVVENEITRCLSALFATVEAHPRLRSSGHLRVLLEDVTSTENRVALARQRYNDAVRHYNTARETVPASLLASPLGFRRAARLMLDDLGSSRPGRGAAGRQVSRPT